MWKNKIKNKMKVQNKISIIFNNTFRKRMYIVKNIYMMYNMIYNMII